MRYDPWEHSVWWEDSRERDYFIPHNCRNQGIQKAHWEHGDRRESVSLKDEYLLGFSKQAQDRQTSTHKGNEQEKESSLCVRGTEDEEGVDTGDGRKGWGCKNKDSWDLTC